MKLIELSRGYFARVSDRDFKRINTLNWCANVKKRKDRSVKGVYAFHTDHRTNKTLLMHRFILGITDSQVEVDHKDHNGLHNERGNLRLATGQQNKSHSRRRVDNTSGFKGVHWNARRSKWYASIRAQGKLTYLGSFVRVGDAAKAYDTAARRQFGKFAVTNF